MRAGRKRKALILHFNSLICKVCIALSQLLSANTVITHQSVLSVTSIRAFRGLNWSRLIKVNDLLDNCQKVFDLTVISSWSWQRGIAETFNMLLILLQWSPWDVNAFDLNSISVAYYNKNDRIDAMGGVKKWERDQRGPQILSWGEEQWRQANQSSGRAESRRWQ